MTIVDYFFILGCVILGAGLLTWVRVSALRAQIVRGLPAAATDAIEIRTLVREPEMGVEKVQAIFAGWAEDDERWRAVTQVLAEYVSEVKLQAVQAEVARNDRELAHANGGYLALVMLEGALWQLREGKVRKQRRV